MVSDGHSQKRHGIETIIVPAPLSVGQEILLQEDLFAALRARASRTGKIITIQDVAGKAFRGRIIELADDQARVRIFEEMMGPAEPPFALVLFQALPARERMELIIQKATELGATAICPLKSRHSISLQEREATQPKSHRWQHIAKKAAEQCRRGLVPTVVPYCSFAEALAQAWDLELKIILCEKEKTRLASLLKDRPVPRGIALLVGPEGGWDEEEVKQAQDEGFIPVGLGGRILRTETAAIAACAILQYAWGGI
jgi:16S rRNA (uracil1498-N3)-methyltransferase